MKKMNTENYCLLLGSEKNRDRSLFGAVRSTSSPIAIMRSNGTINGHRFADIVINGNPNNPEQALLAIEYHKKLTGTVPNSVIPLIELSVETGLAIAKYYNLPYLAPDAVVKARDKQLMKQAFQKHGLPIPRFASFSSFEELKSITKEFLFPVVIKPKNAGGSEGVRLVSSQEELTESYAYLTHALKGYKAAYGLSESAFQIEEYIDAQHEVSVEILNTPAGRRIIAVTDKYLGEHPYFVELGHSVPSIWSNNAAIRNTALAACEALGINRGLTHVELKVMDNGEPVLIEVNARPGGDSILDLVERVTGVNLFELHCKSYLYDTLPPIDSIEITGRSAIAFMKSKPGVIREVTLPKMEELPENVVAFQLWAQKGGLSKKCVDSNTRDGAVEFYWPDDKATTRLTQHLEIAKQLTEKYIQISTDA